MPQVEPWEQTLSVLYRELKAVAPPCTCNNLFTPGKGEEKMAVVSLAIIPGSVFLDFECPLCKRRTTRLIMRQKPPDEIVLDAERFDVPLDDAGSPGGDSP